MQNVNFHVLKFISLDAFLLPSPAPNTHLQTPVLILHTPSRHHIGSSSSPGQQTDNTAPFCSLLQEAGEVPAGLGRLLLHSGSLVAAVQGS